jgi:asparagine synthase (glutamine-hydrolysing)
MCGIAGFYSTVAGDRREFHAIGGYMQNAIAHRGPDDFGIWQDPDVPVLLAQRRLSIIDLSADGHQPMASHSGRYVCVYNGEIYNFLEIRAELERAGSTFKGRSDTEVMLAAFDRWGVNQALQKIGGMFAIILWDREKKQIHFIRDRFGKKPLYVGWGKNALIFGSELKAFHAHPDFTPTINRDALALYMRYGYVCAPYSIYKNVWQVLPGARLTLDVATLRPGMDLAALMEAYWDLPRVVEDRRAHPNTKDEDTIVREFEGLLDKAVAQRMISDVPLGAFLSGGIDSSLVVALMQKNSARPVKTFSIGFEEEAYNEAQHAAKVAAHLGTDHREFYVSGQDALDVIPKLPEIYDEPFADSSQIPTYLISKLARDHVTVVLTGDGGDEILGGYQRHTHIPAVWKKVGWIPASLRGMAGQLARQIPEGAYDALRPGYPQFGRRVHRLAQLIGKKGPREVYEFLIGAWDNAEQVVPGSHLPVIPLTDPSRQPRGLSFAERMIYGDTLSYRPNDLMVKTDRAAMAVALEARAPLMDHLLCEYSWSLPMNMKIRGLTGKWLLREVLKKHVPPALYERPKMGFGIPVNEWLRGPLREWGGDLLSRDRLKAQGLLNADIIAKAWDDHQKGIMVDANATHLWSALMFQAWYERWAKGSR